MAASRRAWVTATPPQVPAPPKDLSYRGHRTIGHFCIVHGDQPVCRVVHRRSLRYAVLHRSWTPASGASSMGTPRAPPDGLSRSSEAHTRVALSSRTIHADTAQRTDAASARPPCMVLSCRDRLSLHGGTQAHTTFRACGPFARFREPSGRRRQRGRARLPLRYPAGWHAPVPRPPPCQRR